MSKKSITELKCLATPPAKAAQVCSIVVMLHSGFVKDQSKYWDIFRKLANEPNFLEKCSNFDVDSFEIERLPKIMEALKTYELDKP